MLGQDRKGKDRLGAGMKKQAIGTTGKYRKRQTTKENSRTRQARKGPEKIRIRRINTNTLYVVNTAGDLIYRSL